MATADNTPTMPFAELRRDYIQRKDQRDKIEAEMKELKATLNHEFTKHMIVEATKMDIDIHQLFGRRKAGRKSNGAGAKARPLYRDPANPSNTWSGRGKPAAWLAEYIKQGRKKEEFKIAEPAPAAKPKDNGTAAPKVTEAAAPKAGLFRSARN